jgi:hypothetical protein
VTFAGLLIAITAAMLFARGSYASNVAGALLFFVAGLSQRMTRMIARIDSQKFVFGSWLGNLADNVAYPVVFGGITAGLHREYGRWALKYGIALIIGGLLSIAVLAVHRKLVAALARPRDCAGRIDPLLDSESENALSRIIRQIHVFVENSEVNHYLLIFTVVGGLPLFFWLAALGSNVTWILSLCFTLRLSRRQPAWEETGKDMQTAA